MPYSFLLNLFVFIFGVLVSYVLYEKVCDYRYTCYLAFIWDSKKLYGIYEYYKSLNPQLNDEKVEVYDEDSWDEEYTPEEFSDFFYLFDRLTATMLEDYDALCSMEHTFSMEQWSNVQNAHDKLINMQNEMRLERWKMGL